MGTIRRDVYGTIDSSVLLNGMLSPDRILTDQQEFLKRCILIKRLSKKGLRVHPHIVSEVKTISLASNKDSRIKEALDALESTIYDDFELTGQTKETYHFLVKKSREIGDELSSMLDRPKLSDVDVRYCASTLQNLKLAPVIAATRDNLIEYTLGYLYGTISRAFISRGYGDNQLYFVGTTDELFSLHKKLREEAKDSNVLKELLGKNLSFSLHNSIARKVWQDKDEK